MKTQAPLPLKEQLPRDADGQLSIPAIEDWQLEKHYKKIRPLAVRGDRLYWIMRPKTLRCTAHLWSPVIKWRALRIVPAFRFRTLHTYAYYGFFKPTVAEVLAQIPEEWLDRCCGFTITEGPADADDLNRENEALNAGFHVATTTLYARP